MNTKYELMPHSYQLVEMFFFYFKMSMSVRGVMAFASTNVTTPWERTNVPAEQVSLWMEIRGVAQVLCTLAIGTA